MLSSFFSWFWPRRAKSVENPVQILSQKLWRPGLYLDTLIIRNFINSQKSIWINTLESLVFYARVQEELRGGPWNGRALNSPQITVFLRQITSDEEMNRDQFDQLLELIYRCLESQVLEALNRPLHPPEMALLLARLEQSFASLVSQRYRAPTPITPVPPPSPADPYQRTRRYTSAFENQLKTACAKICGHEETLEGPFIPERVSLINDFAERRRQIEGNLHFRSLN